MMVMPSASTALPRLENPALSGATVTEKQLGEHDRSARLFARFALQVSVLRPRAIVGRRNLSNSFNIADAPCGGGVV